MKEHYKKAVKLTLSKMCLIVLLSINFQWSLIAQTSSLVAVPDSPGPVREDIGPTSFSYDVFLSNDVNQGGGTLDIVAFDFSGFPGTIKDNRSQRRINFVTTVNFNGQIVIPYTISNGSSTSSSTINLTITDTADDLQIGQDGPFSTDQNMPLSVSIEDLLANDTSIPFLGSSPVELVISEVANAINGSVEISEGNVIFTPQSNFVGDASFTYEVQVLNDGFGPPRPVNIGTSAPIVISVEDNSPVAPSINGTFAIVPKSNENVYLQVDGTANRTSAVVEGCDDGLFWTISDRENGFHRIISVFADRALEAWRPTPRNGDDVTIYSSNNRDWQQWEFIDAGDGYFKIKGKFNPRFLTMSGSNANVQNENFLNNQLWKLVDQDGFVCNDNPIAGQDTFQALLGDTLAIPFAALLANDTDPNGDPIEIVEIRQERLGTATIVGDQVLFTPFGPGALFSYVISDGRGGTDEGFVFIETISGPPPVAVDDDFFEIREDIGLTGIAYATLLANDFDPDGDALSIVGFDFTGFPGTIEDVPANEQILFTTAQDFSGEITFSYTITDGTSTASANIVLTILNLLDPPTVVQDGPFETTKDQSLAISIAALLENDFDPDGDLIDFQSVSGAVNGSVETIGDLIVFTPDNGFVGEASFQYSIVSGTSFPMMTTSDPIIVNVVDAPPSINGSFALVSKADPSLYLQVNNVTNRTSAVIETCDEGQLWEIADRGNGFHRIINVYADKALEAWQRNPGNGDDVTIYSSNNRDWQQWEITDADDGYVRIKGRFNPRFLTFDNGNAIVLDENGSDNQLWKLVDPAEAVCDNTDPIARDDNPVLGGSIQAGVTGFTLSTNSLLGNDEDPDGDDLTVVAVGNFVGVTVDIVSDEVLSLSTAADFSGEASFTYTISDGNGGTAYASATLIVSNQSPIARNDSGFSGLAGESLIIPFSAILANDEDPDGDALTVADITDAQNCTVSFTGNDEVLAVLGTPGIATFAYSNGDGTGRFATAIVVINVSSTSNTATRANTNPVAKESENETLSTSIVIYPNPSNDFITVSLQSDEAVQYEIVNGSGQMVLTGKVSSAENQIDISSIQNGVFFLRLQETNKIFRLIKR